MQFVFVNGRVVHLTPSEMLWANLHPLALGQVAAAIPLLHYFGPFPTAGGLSGVAALSFWLIIAVTFYLGYFSVSMLLARLSGRVVTAWVHLATSGLLTAAGAAFLGVARELHPEPLPLLLVWTFVWALLLLAEIPGSTLVLPWILGRNRRDGSPVAAPVSLSAEAAAQPAPRGNAAPVRAIPPRDLVVGGRSFPVDELRLITSEEHFLRILTSGRSHFLRGRLADVEAQLPEEAGLRIHRSHWVAARAVRGLARQGDGLLVEMDCGARLPVARGRQARVRAWVHGLKANAGSDRPPQTQPVPQPAIRPADSPRPQPG